MRHGDITKDIIGGCIPPELQGSDPDNGNEWYEENQAEDHGLRG
jgi:hypothetical protein